MKQRILMTLVGACFAVTALDAAESRIDRHALVTRHNVTLTSFGLDVPRAKQSVLQVGNGHFAFGFDVTGLQTFMLQGSFSHATLSDWCWHTAANPERYRPEETWLEVPSGGGRAVPYAVNSKHHWPKLPPEQAKRAEGAWNYFRQNPGRWPLGQLRFHIFKTDGKPIEVTDLQKVRQTLDLWTGTVTSFYEIEGVPVEVTTCCHPRQDLVAVRAKSPLIAAGRLKVLVELPGVPTKWETTAQPRGANRMEIAQTLDEDRYCVSVAWSRGEWKASDWKPGWPRRYVMTPARDAEEFSFVCRFSPKPVEELPTFTESAAASAKHWPEFWQSGGAIDLSASKDPRWRELERRIVLAQYLTALNSTGSSPPQESGLFSNSWHGKFHLEMTAWHGIHFALWGRPQLVDGWMRWMRGPGLEAARRQAARQGYKGVRWMKMIAPTAEWESPSDAGPLRMTQQGHAIYWAEEMYRARPRRETLEQFKELVMQSAEFMVDYLWWDENTGRYVLGPPLLTGSEATNWKTTRNSTVELSYWFYGLRTAQLWRERLDLPREAKWDDVLAKLSKPPVVDGLCVDAENAICPARYTPAKGKFLPRPAWFEAYGCMRGDEINREAMARTFDKIWKETNEGCQWMFWGCDFPMMAMTAARLARPKEAVDALLHPGNAYLENGFNNLGSPPYLPASGGFLWTVAMMAAGWDGCPDRHAPGFPDDGSWMVRWEGLKRAQ
ncbi:MAG: glycoside hydrolase family 65 [Verrucomicrobia bacterium]|nr:glycoside hydrolase family 65 [Verrucomicrobiota bacterium]